MKSKKGYMMAVLVAAWLIGLTVSLSADPYADCLNKGWEARIRKDFMSAIEAYRCALRERPASEDAALGLLNAFIEKKDYAGAERYGREFSAKFPGNILIRKSAAFSCYLNGNYAGSEKLYRSILRDGGEECEMRLGLGLSLRRMNRNDEAKKECMKCGDSLKQDGRFLECVQGRETGPAPKISTWKFAPYLYASYFFYPGSWDRNYTAAVTTGVDISHSSGVGFSVEGGYLTSKYHYSTRMSLASLNYALPGIISQVLQNRLSMPSAGPRPPIGADIYNLSVQNLVLSRLDYSSALYREFQPGLGLSYSGSNYFVGAHYVILKAGTDSKNFYHVISLYGNYRYRFFTIGAALDGGIYNDYGTIQAAPELGFRFLDRYSITLVPMLQYGFGTVSNSATTFSPRFSGAIRFSADLPYVTLGLTWYAGNRWHTVEEMGRLVFNSDEEYLWGGAFKMLFLPGTVASPYVSLRLDRGIRQYGMKHGFYSVGASAGLIFNF